MVDCTKRSFHNLFLTYWLWNDLCVCMLYYTHIFITMTKVLVDVECMLAAMWFFIPVGHVTAFAHLSDHLSVLDLAVACSNFCSSARKFCGWLAGSSRKMQLVLLKHDYHASNPVSERNTPFTWSSKLPANVFKIHVLISRFGISWNALNYGKGQRSPCVNKRNSCESARAELVSSLVFLTFLFGKNA